MMSPQLFPVHATNRFLMALHAEPLKSEKPPDKAQSSCLAGRGEGARTHSSQSVEAPTVFKQGVRREPQTSLTHLRNKQPCPAFSGRSIYNVNYLLQENLKHTTAYGSL